ncbi:MAG: BREX system P-loop protein BrxC, partial [Limisphaerales bacterium]
DLIRRKSGKKNILFIIDEVGQYASAKPNLILNLDGLAKNLKQIGGGTVWLFATAQQTLTEDNTSAMLNAPGLYKLKDRFPIQVHLEASDIKEICHQRLLTKSAAGEQQLATLFDASGASLRTATQLSDGGVYEAELTRKAFTDLYPFLPAHFEMLLQLLGCLARKTGGLGLRSAIKVVQDVLIEKGIRSGQRVSLADAPVGVLANTVTFYDSLRRDIQSSYGFIVDGVERVTQRFPNEPLYHDVAKSIAVLQILENLPVTARNLAALLQPTTEAASIATDVEHAITAMLKDSLIPLGEKNGSLRFLTQAAITLQKQFDQIEYRQADVRNELNGVLRSIFKPLPSARLEGVRPVTAGLKVMIGGGQSISLEGDKEAIQIHLEFASASRHEATRSERENDSRSGRERASIFLLGRSDPEAEQIAVTMVRCQKFLDLHRAALDTETKDFVHIVDQRLAREAAELERRLQASFQGGSFIAHGAHQPVSEKGNNNVLEAARGFLGDVAGRVFDRYAEAAHQAESALAEKFLKTPLDRVTANEDPLTLVSRAGGRAQIKTDHKAIVSIKDYLGQNGQVEGRRLLDHFASPPFGWSKDTIRYLLAGAFLGGEIKLRIAGQDHVVKNDDSLAALASNKALGPVGVALRQERPDPDALFRASDRLRNLAGENVLPLEDEIAAAAKKHFPTYQAAFGPLAIELRSLGLDSADQSGRAEDLIGDLTEVVRGDGSDAVKRLGGVDSPLYEDLVWAQKLKKALDNGLRLRLAHLQRLAQEIANLPDSGIPARLKSYAADALASVTEILGRDSFFEQAASLGNAAGELDRLVAAATSDLARQQAELVDMELARWQASYDWSDLADDERSSVTTEVGKLKTESDGTLDGLQKLLRNDYSLNERLRELAVTIAQNATAGREARAEIEARELEQGETAKPSLVEEDVQVPKVFKTTQQVNELMATLTQLRTKVTPSTHLRIRWKEID